MVHIQVNLSENANRTVALVKAANGLKNKAEAVEHIIEEYAEEEREPELRPEFIKKMQRIAKEKAIRIGSLKDFDERYGLS